MSWPLGFSTGSLAPGDIPQALRVVQGLGTTAVELSSLRAAELSGFLAALPNLDLSSFDYISVHAPSRFNQLSEADVVDQLQPVIARGWTLVLHPDSLTDWTLWNTLGDQACIENMDNRKGFGHSVQDLQSVFHRLPHASFCLDVGHARQLDPTLHLAKELVRDFGSRLRQIHLSGVHCNGMHEPLTNELVKEYDEIFKFLPAGTPIILETPANGSQIKEQLELASRLIPVGH